MRTLRNISAILILLVLVVFTIYAFMYKKNTNYVTIDINPSIEFVLNKNDKVIDVVALDEDADILIVELDLIGLSYKDALNSLISASILTGFIDEFSYENSILVAAYSNKEEESERLTDLTISKINEYLENKEVYAVVLSNGLSDQMKEETVMLKISNSKMLFVQKAIDLDKSLSKTELVDMSLVEIQKKIKNYINDRINLVSTSKTAREGIWRSEKAKEIQEYQTYCNAYRETLYTQSSLYDETITGTAREAIVNTLVANEKEKIKLRMSDFNEQLIEENNTNFVEEKGYAIIKNNYEQVKNSLKQRNN